MKGKNQTCNEKIIGSDLHPDSFSLAVTVPDSSGSVRVLQQITQAPMEKWEERLRKLPKPAVIVCEASGNSFELMKTAEKLGFRTCILNSIDVGKIGKQICKTDKLDAVRIAKIYRANLASQVRMPDETTRDLRKVSSMYTQIVKDTTRLINRIKGFLTQHDVRMKKGQTDIRKPEVRIWIQEQYAWTTSDQFLLANYYSELDHNLEIKKSLYDFMLKTVHDCPAMRELMKLCGIRVISAFQIVAAIGDIQRFVNPKKLVAYLGVAPCIHQSGCREYSTGVQQDGRRLIRSLLIECAKSILRSKTTSARHLRDWGIKLKMRRGNNIAACGLARKVAVAIWYALNGFLPAIAENEETLKRKLETVFSEVQLETVKLLGYRSRHAFIEEFSFAILTQKMGENIS